MRARRIRAARVRDRRAPPDAGEGDRAADHPRRSGPSGSPGPAPHHPRRSRGPVRGVLAVSAVLHLAACSFAPAPSVPVPVAEVPAGFAGGDLPGDYRAREWWAAFEDPVLNTVVDSVLHYAAGTDQADDITCLALRYLGPEPIRA